MFSGLHGVVVQQDSHGSSHNMQRYVEGGVLKNWPPISTLSWTFLIVWECLVVLRGDRNLSHWLLKCGHSPGPSWGSHPVIGPTRFTDLELTSGSIAPGWRLKIRKWGFSDPRSWGLAEMQRRRNFGSNFTQETWHLAIEKPIAKVSKSLPVFETSFCSRGRQYRIKGPC